MMKQLTRYHATADSALIQRDAILSQAYAVEQMADVRYASVLLLGRALLSQSRRLAHTLST